MEPRGGGWLSREQALDLCAWIDVATRKTQRELDVEWLRSRASGPESMLAEIADRIERGYEEEA